jgi:hypothetical protein
MEQNCRDTNRKKGLVAALVEELGEAGTTHGII